MENLARIIEAILFTSGNSIKISDISEKFPEVSASELDSAISELQEKYSGQSGILLLKFNNKLQFASNQLYGDVVADFLLPLKEKELSKTLLDVLSIIAYKQPITRIEVEDIRGVNSEYAMQMLSKLNLITVVGRKDSVGRPSLYATTDEFLKRFELESIDDLPDYSDLLEKINVIEGVNTNSSSLFKEVNVSEDPFEKAAAQNTFDTEAAIKEIQSENEESNENSDNDDAFPDEIPDFMKDEDFDEIV